MARTPSAVSSRYLADLDVDVHAAEVADRAAVQEIAQRDQGGGLARLPRRVQHEVTLGPDQAQQLFAIHPVQGETA